MGSKVSKTESELSREDLAELLRETTYDEETIRAWYQVFTRYSGGRNVIQVDDLLQMCSKYERRQLASEQSLRRMFCEKEAGKVGFSDFLTAQYVSTHGTRTEKLARLFRVCDTDRDGYISPTDLSNTIPEWAQQEETKKQIFHDNNGNITENEFIRKCELVISNNIN